MTYYAHFKGGKSLPVRNFSTGLGNLRWDGASNAKHHEKRGLKLLQQAHKEAWERGYFPIRFRGAYIVGYHVVMSFSGQTLYPHIVGPGTPRKFKSQWCSLKITD